MRIAIAINTDGNVMAEVYTVKLRNGTNALKIVPMHGYGKVIYCRRGSMVERHICALWAGKFDRMITMF